MTGEEAVYEFKDILGELRDTIEITENLRNACKIAIKALEQLEIIKEKAELNEDYCIEVGQKQIAGAFREIIDICKGVER